VLKNPESANDVMLAALAGVEPITAAIAKEMRTGRCIDSEIK
jgi:hypothetical protein